MIIQRVAIQLSLSVPFLAKLARTASYRYKEYTIPKRTGGVRTIHHPARELKLVQGWLLQNVLNALPVHLAATAYQKGASIKHNAEKHVTNSYLLRVDFQNFFPSLKGSDVVAVLRANVQSLANVGVMEEEDITFIRQIVCQRNLLTIGAPTSPHLSNAIMFQFDEFWSKRAQELGVTYTRYADDLYFSTNHPKVLEGLLGELRQYLGALNSPALLINQQKTAFSSRKRRRLAAGLVLTSDRRISVGRQKKRMIKSLVWKLKNGALQRGQVASLRGWISYLRSVEPMFVLALQRKYELDLSAAPTWNV